MSDTPEIGGRQPIVVNVEAGRSYWWCACGRSKSQPFCDGSHKGSAFTPVQWTAPESKRVSFCACKQIDTQPLRSGAHQALQAV
jgi:CDGSH iron-sulfur domain-containing protein 3